MKHDLQKVGGGFPLRGNFVSARPYGCGHINDTYLAVYEAEGRLRRYIHQRINHNVFKDPPSLMENIRRVTLHQRKTLAEADLPDRSRRSLTLVPSRDGTSFLRDREDNYWRTYHFIEDTHTCEVAETVKQAYEAAKAFGEFQKMLIDLPGPRLVETIPDFHDTPKRFKALERVIREDPRKRTASAKAEIEFALSRRDAAGHLLEARAKGLLPERITHNDTKLNNVLFDNVGGEGICVVDLDTVMPGLALYDFGDMARTFTSPVAEDERDHSRVEVRIPVFSALAKGYLHSAGAFLQPAEKELLPFASRLITLEIGVRFLADYLIGDTYFKIARGSHNLDRCRTQFKLVRSMEEKKEAMEAAVAE